MLLTHEVPLSIGHVARDISLIHLEVQQPSIKRPWAEFKLALLDVKREPAYIHVTCAHEDTWDGGGENKYEEKEKWMCYISHLDVMSSQLEWESADKCTALKCHITAVHSKLNPIDLLTGAKPDS